MSTPGHRLDKQISLFIDGATFGRIAQLLERRQPQEGDLAPAPTFSSIARAALSRGLRAIEDESAPASSVAS